GTVSGPLRILLRGAHPAGLLHLPVPCRGPTARGRRAGADRDERPFLWAGRSGVRCERGCRTGRGPSATTGGCHGNAPVAPRGAPRPASAHRAVAGPG